MTVTIPRYKKTLTLGLFLAILPLNLFSAPEVTDVQVTDTNTIETALSVNLPEVHVIPGSFLYPPKLWWEEVQLFLARTPTDKIQFLLYTAELRLAEAVRLLQEQQTPLAQNAIDSYHATIARAKAIYTDLEPSQLVGTKLEVQHVKSELISQLLGEYHLKWTR